MSFGVTLFCLYIIKHFFHYVMLQKSLKDIHPCSYNIHCGFIVDFIFIFHRIPCVCRLAGVFPFQMSEENL